MSLDDWIGCLGGLHQFRNVAYVEIDDYDGEVCCNLCGTGWMDHDQRVAHFHGSRHARNYYAVKDLEDEEREEEEERRRQQEEEERERQRMHDELERKIRGMERISIALARMERLEPRVGQLGLERWRQAARSAMYGYIKSARANPIPVGKYNEVLECVSKYEQREALSLLELALWKYSVCNGDLFSSVGEVREYPILEEGFDVAAYLSEARICSGSETIIPCVLSFL